MLRDTVSRTANVWTVGINGIDPPLCREREASRTDVRLLNVFIPVCSALAHHMPDLFFKHLQIF